MRYQSLKGSAYHKGMLCILVGEDDAITNGRGQTTASQKSQSSGENRSVLTFLRRLRDRLDLAVSDLIADCSDWLRCTSIRMS